MRHAAFLTFRDRSALARQESDGYPVRPDIYLVCIYLYPFADRPSPIPLSNLDEHTPVSRYSLNPTHKKPTCQVYLFFAWAGIMLKFCKNPAGLSPAPTYLPTYLPYLWGTKKRNHSMGEGGVLYQLE